jgi:outer membrane biogenesis lipoprotein LolB
MRELLMMNTRIVALCFLAVGSLIFSGCTATTTSTTQTQTDKANKRVYTEKDLKKTGETNPAAALEKADPSVRMSGSR